MQNNEKIIIPYNIKLTAVSAAIAACAPVMLIIAIAAASALPALLAPVFLLAAFVLIIQNKKTVICDKHITVHHPLGILKDETFAPVECGFFIARRADGVLCYTDKRTLHKVIPSDCGKYIYLSEYVLSKQEQEGSQYAYGEPILILKYTAEIYTLLREEFEFNTDPFEK